ncbi:14-3-3-like protein [Tanacetum coccineum]
MGFLMSLYTDEGLKNRDLKSRGNEKSSTGENAGCLRSPLMLSYVDTYANIVYGKIGVLWILEISFGRPPKIKLSDTAHLLIINRGKFKGRLADFAKNRKVLEPRRASWRRIYSIEQKEELHGNNEHAKMAKESRCRIEGEISEICHGLLKLLDEKVLVETKCFGQSKVVYLTMKGDYYRYLAEVKAGDERRQAAECALKAYKSAQDIADTELDPIHQTRLGLAINFSVFYYEILNQSERACSVAKQFRNKNTLQLLFQAIDEAITELTTLGEESDKEDITLILRLLKQNLTMWKSDMQSKTRDESHVVRCATPADKGRERRRRANDRYALAMSLPNEPINDAPSICDIQDEIKKPVKPIDEEQKE